jgi:hypothetical protein
LTIRVDPERHDVGLAAAIAHELQHAAEVLGDASITTDAAMFAFYWTNGLKINGVWETRAAVTVSDAVRTELRQSAARHFARRP